MEESDSYIQEMTLCDDLYVIFSNHIKEKRITIKSIAKKTGNSPSYLSEVLGNKYPLTEKMRIKLNKVLGTNY